MRATGYSLSLVTTLEGQAGIAQGVETLLSQGVDGIVVAEPIDEGEGLRLDVDVPVVSLGPMPGLTAPDVVVLDDMGVTAGRAATEHLLGLGHATVWHVAGPSLWYSAQGRVQGWRETLAAAGAPEPPVVEGDWSPASGYAAGRTLVRADDVTAVFVANDEMARMIASRPHDSASSSTSSRSTHGRRLRSTGGGLAHGLGVARRH